MRIICPHCQATYQVPDARLRPGRLVRCARCTGEWDPLAAPDEAAAPEAAADTPALAEPPPAEPPPAALARPGALSERLRARRWTDDRLALAGWAASLLVLALLLWGGITGRTAVMHGWPPSARLYAALGLLH